MKNNWKPIGLLVIVLLLIIQPIWAIGEPNGPFVLEAISVLRDNYVDQLELNPLIDVAVVSLEKDLAKISIKVKLKRADGAAESEARIIFLEQFNRARKLAVGKLTSTQLAFNAVEAVAQSLKDSHVYFLNPQELERRNKVVSGQSAYVGIGVVIEKKGKRFFLVDVFPDCPADQAGAKVFDEIVRIDGKSPNGELAVHQLTKLIVGEANTKLTLQIRRGPARDVVTLTIWRAPVTIPAITAKIDRKVGYIKLRTFMENGAAVKFIKITNSFVASGAEAFIVDFRGNHGGFIREMQAIAGVFFPNGLTLFKIIDRQRDIYSYGAYGPEKPLLDENVPVAVLIDGESASASEILAAAMQEYGRGLIIGEQSAKAVDMAFSCGLSFDTAMTVTVGRVLTPKGARLGKVGVKPNFVVQPSLVDYENGYDAQYSRAVELVSR